MIPDTAAYDNSTATAVVQVRELVYDYPTARALFGVSLDIEPGSINALVGPNGAGKTTLLRCLAALETPYSGSVFVDGLNVEDHPRDIHKRLGFLQDFFGLYDDLTVRQCLDHHAAAHGVSWVERPAAVEQSAERLGLADRLNQKAGTLSRGLRQRLAVAQAIIHRPKLLLLDEPASGLDPEARQDLSGLLVTLRDEGMTLIVSSHILAELQDYSTHMMIMRDGRIVEHTQLGQAAAATTVNRLLAVLAQPDPHLVEILGGADGVSGVMDAGTSAGFDFAGDAEAQAALLRRLVEAGLPVIEFRPVRANMQDVYLQRIKGATDGESGT